MNAKLGWNTAVAASERLNAEVIQLRAENARLKAEIEALKPEDVTATHDGEGK